ncbi:hypothetical protein SAMN02910344_02020 [Ruminobacter amylophilus]|jgi:hypothetical protein|uniref:Uncharacterized protein n=1 Tax=Ruminobacter amylophilus TaxID=867 RepID=A0A662ZJQ9_9GAMM|nr:hypothetical protein [Ruminobacter amylophilus]SFP67182.1 hypothetical protein SAMN02910344_02020 [Ruminobacter amylophilus]
MKTVAEKVCTARLFEAIAVNGRKLDLKTITGIYPKNTPVTEIIEHLCNYINSFKTVERNEDVRSICNLTTELKNQKECYSVLESKYTETLNELCESRKKQIEQSATNKELSLLTRKQELDIQELKRQLYLKELISDQSTELFPPKLLK